MKVRDFKILPMSKEESDKKIRQMIKESVDKINKLMLSGPLTSETSLQVAMEYESLFLVCHQMIYGLNETLNKLEEMEKKMGGKNEARTIN